MVISVNIGTKIMNMRKEKRLSQEDLGDLIGVSYMTIRRWENQKSKPSLDQIDKLAKIFDVTPEYILGLNEQVQLRNDDNINSDVLLTGGIANNMFIINDKKSDRVYYLPNNEEGRKLFLSVLASGINGANSPVVSNTINGDNNSDNKLGVINN